MITVSVMVGSALSMLIVCTPVPEILKMMLSVPAAALASRIAWRNEPAPESFVLMTV